MLNPDVKWSEFLPPQPFSPINEDGGRIRGSCSSFHERSDVTNDIVAMSCDERSLEKIEEK